MLAVMAHVQEGIRSHGRPAPSTEPDEKTTPNSRVVAFSLRGTNSQALRPPFMFQVVPGAGPLHPKTHEDPVTLGALPPHDSFLHFFEKMMVT